MKIYQNKSFQKRMQNFKNIPKRYATSNSPNLFITLIYINNFFLFAMNGHKTVELS